MGAKYKLEKREIIDISFWTWIPNVSVGPFRFGTPITNYLKRYSLCDGDEYNTLTYPDLKLKSLQSEGFEKMNQYIIPTYDSAFTVYTTSGVIDEFRLETYLFYNCQDIIMTSIEEAMEIIGRSDYDDERTEEVIDEIQRVFYFYDLGLSLWTQDGVVVTAFCDDGTRWNPNR